MVPVFSRIGKPLASWKWVLGYTALLLMTLSQARHFLDWLVARNLSGLPGLFLLFTGIACLVFLAHRIHRVLGGFTLTALLRMLGLLGLYLGCMFASTDLTVDRIHFVEYGVLGLLCFQAVGPSYGTCRRVGYAIVAVFAVGFLDETVQGFLADRYFDIRDVVIDLLAGFLPILGSLWFRSPAVEPQKRDTRSPRRPAAGTRKGARSIRPADVTALLLAFLLLFGVLWVDSMPLDPAPLYGRWERINQCGEQETIQIAEDGAISWEDAAGGRARGTYRVRGNRLDGPMLEVEVLQAEGSDPCAWSTAEVRNRYFRVDAGELVFTKERGFPFRRVDSATDPQAALSIRVRAPAGIPAPPGRGEGRGPASF